jgi:signal transduction histidine kinase
LGLSVSYGIIEKHHGQVVVYSEVGKGTTFSITLPPAGAAVTSRDWQMRQQPANRDTGGSGEGRNQ